MRNSQTARLATWRAVLVLFFWIASLGAAALAGALAYRDRAEIRDLLAGRTVIETNLYNVVVREVALPVGERDDSRGGIEGRDGGVTPLGEGVLVSDRMGLLWYLEPDLTLRPLETRVPLNYDDFADDPYNAGTTIRSRFAVKDIFVQEMPDKIRLVASYNRWYAADDCYSILVGSLQTTTEDLLSDKAAAPSDWKTHFETPCIPLSENQGGTVRNPTNGAGGRLAALSNDRLLFSMGGFGPATPKDPDGPYGKTILIDLSTETWRYFSRGHRNPQGLFVSTGGQIWLTEHAERGGDELNLIRDGVDYGFPNVSYGTNYQSMVWKNSPTQGRHAGYEKPTFAWVPSVGVSQLTTVEGQLFGHWWGDLIVSSLKAGSLFRVRIDGGKVVFVEPIRVGHRIRDIAERVDGALVLKTDGDRLVVLTPVDLGSAAAADVDPVIRGQILASTCSGCHSLTSTGNDGLGPTLWDVVDRPIASRRGYGAYSDALRAQGGRWTPDRLRAFLSDPDGFAPGTTMQLTSTHGAGEIDDIVTYLETLR